MAVHAFAHPALALLGDEARLVVLIDEVVQIVIGLENHVTASPAIAAAGAAFGPGGFAMEGDAALAAAAGAGEDLDLIDKHASFLRSPSRGTPERVHKIHSPAPHLIFPVVQ